MINTHKLIHYSNLPLFILFLRFQDFRRDLQAVIGTRANINIAQIEDYGGETFLSEELVISLIQESKQAFYRCKLVCKFFYIVLIILVSLFSYC